MPPRWLPQELGRPRTLNLFAPKNPARTLGPSLPKLRLALGIFSWFGQASAESHPSAKVLALRNFPPGFCIFFGRQAPISFGGGPHFFSEILSQRKKAPEEIFSWLHPAPQA